MSPAARRTPRRRQGAAAVELAVTLPMLVTMLLGILEMGRVLEMQQLLGNAAREGGRQASTGLLTNAQVAQVVTAYLSESDLNLNTSHVNVTVSDLTNPGVDATQASQLDQLQVVVTIPYGDVSLVKTNLMFSPSTLLTASANWPSQVDKPYPQPPLPPIE
jgi:Flp pilus assembly protein TadG